MSRYCFCLCLFCLLIDVNLHALSLLCSPSGILRLLDLFMFCVLLKCWSEALLLFSPQLSTQMLSPVLFSCSLSIRRALEAGRPLLDASIVALFRCRVDTCLFPCSCDCYAEASHLVISDHAAIPLKSRTVLEWLF